MSGEEEDEEYSDGADGDYSGGEGDSRCDGHRGWGMEHDDDSVGNLEGELRKRHEASRAHARQESREKMEKRIKAHHHKNEQRDRQVKKESQRGKSSSRGRWRA